MAIRTNVNDIRDYMGVKIAGTSSSNADNKITLYLNVATIIVDEVEANDSSSLMSVTTLEQLEAMVTAHMLSMTTHRQEKSTAKQGATAEFQGNLNFTDYRQTTFGQIALQLDKTNTLSAINIGPDHSGILAIN